ncbi:sensor histidine kinase [Planctomyces sp. SH-PL62]|uniref:sensor histidine kinase n=1 Tax=Planctomyces sp. SH-PL62 TaxID=1636152 RepID=UPI00078D1123|nr:HAMP domain-containing sensor histidine kinase [Planctomyces sp. SH-PL62]AMV36775.1 Globin-coupled histidine kinase [Planctomyces sp. SH-PL62]
MKYDGDRSVEPSPGGGWADLTDHLWRFRSQYRDVRDPDKILRGALRLGMDLSGACEGCVGAIQPGLGEARLLHRTSEDASWDRRLLSGFLRGEKVAVPPDVMLARLRRHGRMWGALAIRSADATFHWDARQAFSAIGGLANELIDQADLFRIREVRARVDRKVLEQSHPKHLSYEVLHGIRSLIAYDHSAALLIHDADLGVLEVVAEQVAWRKAKGENVGRKFPLKASLHELLAQPVVLGFDRAEGGDGWTDWAGGGSPLLAELLDYDRVSRYGTFAPPEGAILCASLITRSGLLGVLKVASIHPGSFCPYEVDLISQFLPQAAVSLQNARRTETLERRMIDAERKHAMADLARGVSHDVNNALGAVLPLVQQLLDDLETDAFDPESATADLLQVERSIRVCRRIFGGMLNFARGSARNPSDVSPAQAVDSALVIFRETLERRGVTLTVDVPADLPPLFAVQADVEQLLLNLISNARDATGPGDSLTIRARTVEGWLVLEVEDTGSGIPPEDLAKLQEPFFTTKPNGHGLGVAICRSIAAQLRGRFSIDSIPGEGTRVRVDFPIDEGREGS